MRDNAAACTEALSHLEQLRPNGPWVLSAIDPVKKDTITTITATNADEVREFIEEYNGKRNLHFAVNPTRHAMAKKPAKKDIAQIEYLFGDLDPKDDETPDAAKDRYRAELDAYPLAPTAVINSGNGLQPLWRLQQPIPLEPPRTRNKDDRTGLEFPPELKDVEARTKKLMQDLGSVAGTQNIDRLLRLPGTINLPNAVKKAKGRVPCDTSLLKFNCINHPFESFPKSEAGPDTTTPQEGRAKDSKPDIFEEHSLPEDLLALIRNGIWQGRKVPTGERSEHAYHAMAWLKEKGWTVEEIIALLWKYRKNGIAARYTRQARLREDVQRTYAKTKAPDRDSGADDANADTDQLILSDKDHMSRACKLRDLKRPDLVHYRDDFMDFKDGAYRVVEDGAIDSHVWLFLDKAYARRKDGRGADAEFKTVPFCPNRNSVGETMAALKSITRLNSYTEMPSWLNGRADLPPDQIIAFPNGLLDLRTNTLHPIDPKFFTIAALGFDYVAPDDAPKPTLWLKFLDEIFAGDDKDEQIVLVQEIFGYLLTADTSLEKAFLFLGPKRSGKGTMLGMLRKLLAKCVVAGPSLKSFANTFGMTPLIDKQLAIIDDLRVGSLKDQDILIENVLKITGRGLFTIDRKYKDAWTGTLPVKLLLVSNPMPKLGDDSAALASRFIILITRVSFFGREDPRLLDKLTPELTGVFHWALQGLQRLRKRGHFIETAASEEARERLANLGSPARAFIAERCILDPRVFAEKDEMYTEWCDYARDSNMLPGTPEKFFEALYAAGGGLIQAGRPVITFRNEWNGVPIKNEKSIVQKKQINAVMGI